MPIDRVAIIPLVPFCTNAVDVAGVARRSEHPLVVFVLASRHQAEVRDFIVAEFKPAGTVIGLHVNDATIFQSQRVSDSAIGQYRRVDSRIQIDRFLILELLVTDHEGDHVTVWYHRLSAGQ